MVLSVSRDFLLSVDLPFFCRLLVSVALARNLLPLYRWLHRDAAVLFFDVHNFFELFVAASVTALLVPLSAPHTAHTSSLKSLWTY